MNIYYLEDVFVTEGVPQFTFVPPPNYVEILLDVRRSGKPVIIEGQSGTGKTTAIKRIISSIGVESVSYLSARQPDDVLEIIKIIDDRKDGFFVIDDFHRLQNDIREGLANIAKLAAEQGEDNKSLKLVIIGINQVGSDLIQLVPDIAKRTGIHRIEPGTYSEIKTLIENGCERLNIEFTDIEEIYKESRGDYWLTQQICQAACAMEKISETSPNTLKVKIDTDEIRSRVVTRLRSAYYPAVKSFCRGRRFRPSNDPYFKLLKTIGQQESSVIDLNELQNAIPEVRGSINNIKDRRLSVLLDSKAECKSYFYYNSETKNFAIEDPALFYFIRHLDWSQLRLDCGFREENKAKDWDIAISFAGENRELAKVIAEELELQDVHVFFDEFYENNYLGKAWSENFKSIFSEKSSLIVALLDKHHQEKIWPTFERDCFTPRVSEGDVIPVILDDTLFTGIPKDIAAIYFRWDPADPEWRTKARSQIVEKLLDRMV